MVSDRIQATFVEVTNTDVFNCTCHCYHTVVFTTYSCSKL